MFSTTASTPATRRWSRAPSPACRRERRWDSHSACKLAAAGKEGSEDVRKRAGMPGPMTTDAALARWKASSYLETLGLDVRWVVDGHRLRGHLHHAELLDGTLSGKRWEENG